MSSTSCGVRLKHKVNMSFNKPGAAFTVAQKYLPCAFLLSTETIDVNVKDNP